MIGHIYRIQHIQSELCYVGSTFSEVKHRWSIHKSAFKKWNEHAGKCNAAIYPHIKEHGLDQFKCFLVKSYEVVDRDHLEAYETLWIKKLKGCNQVSPFAIKKLNDKHLYLKNREERCSKARAYAAANKDLIKERTKEYRANNKEKIKAKKSVKMTCKCGMVFARDHKARHERSAKHQNWEAVQ